MKRIAVLGVLLALALGAGGIARADSGMQFAPGSKWPAYPSVTVGTACGTVLTAHPDKRMYSVICNDGANKAYCAGSGFATSSQGSPIQANSCATLPYSGAVDCCAATGTTVIAPGEINR